MSDAEIGVFGGSGFYSFLDDAEEVAVDTPVRPDVRPVRDRRRRRQAGRVHAPPRPQPQPAAARHPLPGEPVGDARARRPPGDRPVRLGSLTKDLPPGTFVVCDQFVDRTSGRADTFYDGPATTHVSSADPYCPDLRSVLLETGREQGLDIRDGGTVVVIQGPRFSTRAESKWFSAMGWGVINMTAYPEGWLARELELCYANISLITDYDVGARGRPGRRPGQPRGGRQGVHREQRAAARAAVRRHPEDRRTAEGHLRDARSRAPGSEPLLRHKPGTVPA